MKKRIVVIFGGHSTEYDVSLQSAFSVLQNINRKHFEIVPVGITRDGEWYHYTGKIENISNNSWFEDEGNLYPIMVSQSRLAQGFREFMGISVERFQLIWYFPYYMAKMEKMALCKDCLNWQGYRLLDAIRFHRRFVWTRTGRINLSALQESLFLNLYLSGVLKKKQLIRK